jgi:adenylate cyclase
VVVGGQSLARIDGPLRRISSNSVAGKRFIGLGMPFRRGLRVMAIAGTVATVGAAASLTAIGFGLEEEIGLQWLFDVRGPRPPPPQAVVVRFDRDALARLRALPPDSAQWPQPLASCTARHGTMPTLADATRLDRLPRGVVTCLIEELARRGAVVIAFDISFRRDPSREDGIPTLAAALEQHGGVILLDQAVRQLGQAAAVPSSRRDPVQADWLEGPHPELAAAAIATAPFLLPRGTSRLHQFWTFNPALPAPTQMPVRALEVLAQHALINLVHATEEDVPTTLSSAKRLNRLTDWFRAQVATSDGGISHAELARLSPNDSFVLRALSRTYRGPDAYFLNFYGPPWHVPLALGRRSARA